MKISKMPVTLSAFAFLLLSGLLIKDSTYKPMNLFWTDLFGVFVMPVGVAITGACFVFQLLLWYELTRTPDHGKADSETDGGNDNGR